MTFAEAMKVLDAMIAELDERIARVIESVKQHDEERLSVARAKERIDLQVKQLTRAMSKARYGNQG